MERRRGAERLLFQGFDQLVCRPYFLLLSGGNCHFISWIARKINVRRSLVIYTVGNRPTGLAAVLIEILGEGEKGRGNGVSHNSVRDVTCCRERRARGTRLFCRFHDFVSRLIRLSCLASTIRIGGSVRFLSGCVTTPRVVREILIMQKFYRGYFQENDIDNKLNKQDIKCKVQFSGMWNNKNRNSRKKYRELSRHAFFFFFFFSFYFT